MDDKSHYEVHEAVSAPKAGGQPNGHDANEADDTSDAMIATVATLGVVAVGVAVVEAALLPGVVLGAAAMIVPKFMPQIGSALRPMFRSTVRGAYRISQKTRQFVAETQEHVHDIVAEVDADAAAGETLPKSAAATARSK